MNPKLLITLTTLTLTAFAITARAGHRAFPQLPTKQNELPGEQTGAPREPVKSVLDHYLNIQSALANDSIGGVASNALAIASAVRGDSMKMLSPEMAAQADALAKTKDLAQARAVFKRLSKSLIQYLANHKITSAYVEVYCPMAKAAAKGQEDQQPLLRRFDAQLRNDQVEARRITIRWLTDEELKHV